MAYGRFNQVAQPGDGVTQLWGKVGPYDWRPSATATASSAPTRASERRELAAFAETFSRDRRCSGAAKKAAN
jgi:hypothetical protein